MSYNNLLNRLLKFFTVGLSITAILLGVSCVNTTTSHRSAKTGDAKENQIKPSLLSTLSFISDGAPTRFVDVERIPDAVPRFEPRTIAGNKSPYEVNGQRYVVMPDSVGYREVGISSWYGTKFHGRKTANGEIYDLYKMTAAHKSLPIPTYLQVTNLENGRRAIVRVNDRGPFHGDRIIDLSYAAAAKLGFAEKGIAKVSLMAIDPATHSHSAEGAIVPDYKLPDNTFLQVGAFSNVQAADRLKTRLEKMVEHNVSVFQVATSTQTLYRVRVGPVTSKQAVLEISDLLRKREAINPQIVTGDI